MARWCHSHGATDNRAWSGQKGASKMNTITYPSPSTRELGGCLCTGAYARVLRVFTLDSWEDFKNHVGCPTGVGMDWRGVPTHDKHIRLSRDSVLTSNKTRLDWTKNQKAGHEESKRAYWTPKEAMTRQIFTIPYLNRSKKGWMQLTQSR